MTKKHGRRREELRLVNAAKKAEREAARIERDALREVEASARRDAAKKRLAHYRAILDAAKHAVAGNGNGANVPPSGGTPTPTPTPAGATTGVPAGTSAVAAPARP